jgi:hypothetical protein
MSKSGRRPGEEFIDRYLPRATQTERDDAYENMRRFIALLMQINERLAREGLQRHDSPKSGEDGRVKIPA